MLVSNTDIWLTRIQSVEALITATVSGRSEVYYSATLCQVSLDPPLISVSPNPDYPICTVIEQSGVFGINYLAEGQGPLVARCIELNRAELNKVDALGVEREYTDRGTPLLTDCLLSLECEVVKTWDSGDHRTIIARVLQRRERVSRLEQPPRRFGGSTPPLKRRVKEALCRSGIYGATAWAKSLLETASIEHGTRAQIEPPLVPGRHVTPPVPGVCLVGCGWWGAVHALSMKQQGPRIRRFFAGRAPERVSDFARRFEGEAVAGGLHGALADPRINAVVLALPHHLHAEAARAALEAGKHVLVEKPIAITVSDAEQLCALARREGLCLAVAEQYRLSPISRAALDVIRSGRLGRIALLHACVSARYRPPAGWKTNPEMAGGGVLLDVGIHYVDLIRSWFGKPNRVVAMTSSPSATNIRGEETGTLLLQFAQGVLATIQISWSSVGPADTPNITIFGERGALELWFNRPYLKLTTALPGGHWSARIRRTLPWRVVSRIGWMLPTSLHTRIRVPGNDLNGSRLLISDFVAAIKCGHEAAVPGSEGLEDLKVVVAGYASGET